MKLIFFLWHCVHPTFDVVAENIASTRRLKLNEDDTVQYQPVSSSREHSFNKKIET
ncbi:MAG: hypothetical protein BAJALOKI1v1_150029 [Promethearchaeota archaeon]|nr:MAG: hypothetical protein BAJALOKI1v1_150029 [Candidatus Lokiarchaeota archaeon]